MSLPIADESQPPRKFNKWVRDAGPVPFVEVLITVRHRTIPGRFGVMTGYMTHEKEWRCSQWVHAGNPEGTLPAHFKVVSWMPMPQPDPELTREYREDKEKRDRQQKAIEAARRDRD